MNATCSLCSRVGEVYEDRGKTDTDGLPRRWAVVAMTLQGGNPRVRSKIVCNNCMTRSIVLLK